MQLSAPAAELYERVLLMMSLFEGVRAVGLTGSRTTGQADPFSDLDLLVLTNKVVPPGDVRLQQYKTLDAHSYIFDADIGAVRHDSLVSGGMGLDLYWCSQPALETYLRDLTIVFSNDEALAAALTTVEPAYDPAEVLARTKRQIPAYPEERAVYRVRRCLQSAHLVFNVTRRLEIAAVRNDVIDFARTAHELLDKLVVGVFALNRRWYGGQNRLDAKVKDFNVLPDDFSIRLENIRLYRDGYDDLAACHDGVQNLYEETLELARKALGSAALPVDWK